MVSEPDRQTRRGREGDPQPWAVPGTVRRDAQPHRGPFLACLGFAALMCGLFSVCLALPALIALPLGLAVWRMADHDLHEMRQGRMDPAGRRETVPALLWGTLGALLSPLGCVPVVFQWLYVVY